MKNVYLNNRLFFALLTNIVFFVLAHFFPLFISIARVSLLIIFTCIIFDVLILFLPQKVLKGKRIIPERLSNGDENTIIIEVTSLYNISLRVKIIDEIPYPFQVRHFTIESRIKSSQTKHFTYTLIPVKRGMYSFGKLNIYALSPIGIIERRYSFDEGKEVPVYPSYIQMKKYELIAVSNTLKDTGIKRIRRIGQHTEFDQIREYVKGDDYRTMNWKATARKADFMVNQYQDERSQQVYAVIDMGRVMKMPFEQMTLLDYAINTSLAILNMAMKKHDKAGLVTFTHQIETLLPADRKGDQMIKIMELLYAQQTNFQESNYELLYYTIRKKIHQRSLLILYTNFESLSSLHRQLPYFQRLAKSHLLLVVFFENTEIKNIIATRPDTLDAIYLKTIAEKYMFEKRQIVKKLQQYGVYSVLTSPHNLTVDTINKYLEFKARGLI